MDMVRDRALQCLTEGDFGLYVISPVGLIQGCCRIIDGVGDWDDLSGHDECRRDYISLLILQDDSVWYKLLEHKLLEKILCRGEQKWYVTDGYTVVDLGPCVLTGLTRREESQKPQRFGLTLRGCPMMNRREEDFRDGRQNAPKPALP